MRGLWHIYMFWAMVVFPVPIIEMYSNCKEGHLLYSCSSSMKEELSNH